MPDTTSALLTELINPSLFLKNRPVEGFWTTNHDAEFLSFPDYALRVSKMDDDFALVARKRSREYRRLQDLISTTSIASALAFPISLVFSNPGRPGPYYQATSDVAVNNRFSAS